jgi:SAM-dependent methyltransferase
MLMEEQTLGKQDLVTTRNLSIFLPGTDENEEVRAWQLLHEMLITKAMGGPLVEQPEPHLEMIYDVLDLGCGSGGWALKVAQTYPEMRVTGVDVSPTARCCAEMYVAIEHLENVHFQIMDITQPLQFPDASFDLVNERLISGALSPAQWPFLLEECARVLRPGGVARLTEGAWSITTATTPEVIRLLDLCWEALSAAGYRRSSDPCPQAMIYLLRRAGFQNVSCRAWALDYSSGTILHASFVEGYKRLFTYARPFIVQQRLVTQEEVDQFYHRAITEVASEHFVALLSLLTVWGTRPQERVLREAQCQDLAKQ